MAPLFPVLSWLDSVIRLDGFPTAYYRCAPAIHDQPIELFARAFDVGVGLVCARQAGTASPHEALFRRG